MASGNFKMEIDSSRNILHGPAKYLPLVRLFSDLKIRARVFR